MNKIRRKELQKATDIINEAINIIEDVLADEEMAFENLSEGLQQTMRGEQMEDNIGEMEECLDNLNSALDNLNSIQ